MFWKDSKPFHWRRLWERTKSPTLLLTTDKTTEDLFPNIPMGEIPPSSSEPTMDQRLLSLEQMLRDQQEFHQQQLASFLAAYSALREENTTLRDAATVPRLSNYLCPAALHDPSPPTITLLPLVWGHPVSNPQLLQNPSRRRTLDLVLRVLDDIFASPS